jgi:colanic acid biosynthesis glycosyl transferase WcaI
VLRCCSALSAESRILSRFAENISFGLTSGWAALISQRPDVIYANSWPIFATGILTLVARLRRIPLVISVQDIYSKSLISRGRIRAGSRMARMLTIADRRIAHASRDAIVTSERFAEVYLAQRGVPADRVHMVPNWVDDRNMPQEGGSAVVRLAMGIPSDAFLLVYGGNVGWLPALKA